MNFIITQDQVDGIWKVISKIPTEVGVPIYEILKALTPIEQKPTNEQQPITEG